MSEIQYSEIPSKAIRLHIEEDGKEVARAYLFLITNDLHSEPYGLLEDVFVDEQTRGKGYGTQIVKSVIEKAKELGCYKLIGQSRYGRERVHELYMRLGFEDHGKNFRMDF